jgi:hypothetical protein
VSDFAKDGGSGKMKKSGTAELVPDVIEEIRNEKQEFIFA